jgi:hypothetical protein
MDAAALARRLQPNQAHEPVACRIEREDEGPEDGEEQVEGTGHPEGRGVGPLQGDALGRQLADDDVQRGGDEEGQRKSHAIGRDGRVGLVRQHMSKEGLEQVCEGRLADEAKGERGHGDAQLGHGDVGIEVAQRAPHLTCPHAPLVHQLLNARAPHADEGELGGDEEAVEEHQRQHGDQAQSHGPLIWVTYAGGRSGQGSRPR